MYKNGKCIKRLVVNRGLWIFFTTNREITNKSRHKSSQNSHIKGQKPPSEYFHSWTFVDAARRFFKRLTFWLLSIYLSSRMQLTQKTVRTLTMSAPQPA